MFTCANVMRSVKLWNPFYCDWHHNELFGETVTAYHRPVSYLVCTNVYSLSHFVTFSWNCGEMQWDGQYSNDRVAKCNSTGATLSNMGKYMRCIRWDFFDKIYLIADNAKCDRTMCLLTILTPWGRDRMAAMSQTMFSNAFSWMEINEFRLKFHWSLFLRVQLTIFQHWLR